MTGLVVARVALAEPTGPVARADPVETVALAARADVVALAEPNYGVLPWAQHSSKKAVSKALAPGSGQSGEAA